MKSINNSLSVVIVNYNGFNFLQACINSIINSKTENFEIIGVDNGSKEGDVEKFRAKYQFPNTHIIALDKNYGPAYARNIGVANSRGEYLAFLDNDTLVKDDWAIQAIKLFEKNKKIGIIQCKLLLAKDRKKIDYVGEYIGQNGFLVQPVKAGEIDEGQFDRETEILAAKSAGMFIRRTVFYKAGGFDSDYFIYVEETDLGWRTWLTGYKVVFCPWSVVYHEFGSSTIILGKVLNTYNAKFHGSKNYILTHAKNLDAQNIIRILIPHIILWEGLAIYSLFKMDLNAFLWINKGIFWNLKNIRSTLRKRVDIQSRRKISDDRLFSKIMKKRSIMYFINKAIIKHKVGNAESF